jgi:hypothetical protein
LFLSFPFGCLTKKERKERQTKGSVLVAQEWGSDKNKKDADESEISSEASAPFM